MDITKNKSSFLGGNFSVNYYLNLSIQEPCVRASQLLLLSRQGQPCGWAGLFSTPPGGSEWLRAGAREGPRLPVSSATLGDVSMRKYISLVEVTIRLKNGIREEHWATKLKYISEGNHKHLEKHSHIKIRKMFACLGHIEIQTFCFVFGFLSALAMMKLAL